MYILLYTCWDLEYIIINTENSNNEKEMEVDSSMYLAFL